MAYYRFVATALLLRQCQWWHKMQSRQQQHSQPACPSSFLSTYHEQAGQGCRWCRIEPPMTLIGCLLAVAADSDGEGSAAASNETLATVFTQVWLAQTNIGLQLQRCLLNEKNLIQDEYGNCTDKTRNIFSKVVLNSAMPAADAKLRQKSDLNEPIYETRTARLILR
ncbi:uncharacterized protein [Miscanthus floridulus]|uniref:uncharacterized protein isoform X5 n=1 Tax=Miscanthus floridulus TaxID=154761 RepID=UPI003457C4A1